MSALYTSPDAVWQRILAKTDQTGECWIFTGAVTSRGYGCVGAGRKGKNVLTHRVSVIVRDGSIPDGMTVDHLCRNKRCVNPAHLEVVTIAENSKRDREARGYRMGGECGAGHTLTEETVYRHPRGQLVCRECQRRHAPRTLRMVREWARANGFEVADRGRISGAVIDAYMSIQERAA